MASEPIIKSPHRMFQDKARGGPSNGYIESPQKLELQREAGLQRTRQRLAEQREELARRARVRGNAGLPASRERGESAEGPQGRVI